MPTTASVFEGARAFRTKSVAGLRRAFTRQHALMTALFAVGVALRIAFHVAYPVAFFYPDSERYLDAALRWLTDPTRPFGYSLFLAPFGWHHLILVAAAQHLLVLGLALLAYRFLLRRGVRGWVAALAVAPMLLGPTELVLEHYILTEALFMALTLVGLIALTRTGKDAPAPSPGRRIGAAVLAGLLLALAAATRTAGLPIVALGGLYLLIRLRSVGLRVIVAFAVAGAAPLVGFLAFYHAQHGVYGFGEYQGRFLYARTMTIADCGKLPKKYLRYCQPVDKAQRQPRADWFVWAKQSAGNIYAPGVKNDPKLQSFALAVIKRQPVDFAVMVTRETVWFFVPPIQPTDALTVCHNQLWLPPASPNGECKPINYIIPVTPFKVPPPQTAVPPTVTSRVLADYGTTEIVYLPIMGLAALATVIVAIAGLRRGDRRLLGDGLLFVATGVGLVVISVATSMFELRYAIPSIPIVTIGLVLALRGMRPASAAPHGVASEHGPGSDRPAALPERSGDAGGLHPQGVGQPA